MTTNIQYFSDFSDQRMLSDLSEVYKSVFDSEVSAHVEQVQAYNNKIILLAYKNEKPVGFKIGYTLPEDETTLYSWAGGTIAECRGMGIASKLMEEQHKKCTALGINTVETKCRDKWASMMSLNKTFGFKIVKEYTGSCGTKKYLLRKSLGQTQS